MGALPCQPGGPSSLLSLVSWQPPPCPPSTVARRKSDTNRRLLPRRLHRGAILAHGFTTDFLVDLICAGLATDQGAVPPGSRTVNTEPLPGSLATVTSPPIMRASLREMARPSPVPP